MEINNTFINKIIFKIFGPLAGSLDFRCLRHRGFAKSVAFTVLPNQIQRKACYHQSHLCPVSAPLVPRPIRIRSGHKPYGHFAFVPRGFGHKFD